MARGFHRFLRVGPQGLSLKDFHQVNWIDSFVLQVDFGKDSTVFIRRGDLNRLFAHLPPVGKSRVLDPMMIRKGLSCHGAMFECVEKAFA